MVFLVGPVWATNRAEHSRAARRDTILCRCLLRDSFLKLWARSYRVSKPPFVPHVLLLTQLDPCFFKKPPSLMMHNGLKSLLRKQSDYLESPIGPYLFRDSFLKLWVRFYWVLKPTFVPYVLLLTQLDPSWCWVSCWQDH